MSNLKKNYKKGTRKDVIKTLHMTGILPIKALSMYDTPRTYKDKIREMEKEKLVCSDRLKLNGHSYRYVYLNDFEKKREEYGDSLPDGFYESYITYGAEALRQARSKGGSAAARAISDSEAFIMMNSAGIACEPDTKPFLRGKGFIDDVPSCYFQSKEVKGYTNYRDKANMETKDGEQIKLVVSSRLTGLLVSRGGVYAVYNIGSNLSSWRKGRETRIAQHITFMLRDKMQNPRDLDTCLILTDCYGELSRALAPATRRDESAAASFENLSYIYNRIMALPFTATGRRMLEIMKTDRWEDAIRSTFLAGYTTEDIMYQGVPCDAYKEENGVMTYLMLFCIPDIKKLQKFKKAAQIAGDKDRYIVACFDFQAELVSRSSNNAYRVFTANFDGFYGMFKGAEW